MKRLDDKPGHHVEWPAVRLSFPQGSQGDLLAVVVAVIALLRLAPDLLQYDFMLITRLGGAHTGNVEYGNCGQ